MDITLITGLKYESSEFIFFAGGVITIVAIIIAYKMTFQQQGKSKKETSPVPVAELQQNEEDTTNQPEDEVNVSETVKEQVKDSTKSNNTNAEADEFEKLVKEEALGAEEIDPVEYSQHIPSHIKRTEQKVALQKIEADMTDEQKEQERSIQQQQMEAIFKLMQENQDTFGLSSKEDVQAQMKLYM